MFHVIIDSSSLSSWKLWPHSHRLNHHILGVWVLKNIFPNFILFCLYLFFSNFQKNLIFIYFSNFDNLYKFVCLHMNYKWTLLVRVELVKSDIVWKIFIYLFIYISISLLWTLLFCWPGVHRQQAEHLSSFMVYYWKLAFLRMIFISQYLFSLFPIRKSNK